MGQKESKEKIQQGNAQKFGKVEYITPSNKNEKIKMRVAFQFDNDPQKFKVWTEKMQSLKQITEIVDLVMFPINIDRSSCLLCNTTNKRNILQIQYEKITYTLSQVIHNRHFFKKYFDEKEIWYLLYALIKVAAFLQDRSDYIGNIHPNNVMINDEGRILLFTMLSSPAEKENITAIRQSRHFDVFIAPEQIKLIHEDSVICLNDCNNNKVDLFNIGLLLLSVVLLKDCYFIYNRSLFELSEDKLYKSLEDMKKIHTSNYSRILLAFIEEFLIIDPSVRKTPKYYYNKLKKYEKEIIQLKQFNFEGDHNCLGTSESPQVLSYLQKQITTGKQTKYLALAKHLKQKITDVEDKKAEKSAIGQLDQIESTLARKLFNE